MNFAFARRALSVGPVGLARALVRRLQRSPEAPAAPDAFDLTYGLDTAGFVSWRALRTRDDSDAFNAGYLGVDPDVARNSFARIEAPERFSFLDLGCGKGRALVVASEFGFRGIIGVELSPALAATAARNLDIVRARHPDRAPMRVEHNDAANLNFPPGPFVLFLYHPFEAPVMAKVAARLAVSLVASPREAIIIYVNARLARFFDAMTLLERVDAGDEEPSAAKSMLWRSRSPRPAVSAL